MSTRPDPHFAGYHYPVGGISTAVWLYFRFSLNMRMVEEMLAVRGITVSYETIRQWGVKFSRDIANSLRRGDKWHLDEVVLTLGGKRQYLWWAVDKEGFVLDVLVQSRWDAKAAKLWTRPGVKHRQHKGLNNRADRTARTQVRNLGGSRRCPPRCVILTCLARHISILMRKPAQTR